MVKVMVCGTVGAEYDYQKFKALILSLRDRFSVVELVTSQGSHSPDAWAEQLSKESGLKLNVFPATKDIYLKVNKTMVRHSDMVYSFWDGYSYGTAHAIATAVLFKKPVFVIPVKRKENKLQKTVNKKFAGKQRQLEANKEATRKEH